MEGKIKVVWLSQVSNPKVREHLRFENSVIEQIARKLTHRPKKAYTDNWQWITNGLNEYENSKSIELHFVGPHIGIKGIQEFELNGIHYHFFRSEDDYPFLKSVFKKPKAYSEYPKNRAVITSMIERIKPDIVHIIGAENPKYSLAALDIDVETQLLIVSLQTLMLAPGFKENYPVSEEIYKYRSNCERRVLKHTHYIGSKGKMFKEVVWGSINPRAVFLHSTIFVGETINRAETKKKYDVIYYARDIVKAFDIALKIMREVVIRKPDVSMCVVGMCGTAYMADYKAIIEEYGIASNIVFLGMLPSHEDVLNTLRSAKVALLPVKVDGITSTMREAMANGVPVVTTKTWGTPYLNTSRTSAFIEEQDDYAAMAEDVIKLLEDEATYNEIRENGYVTCSEKYSNESYAQTQTEIYSALKDFKAKGIPIPEDLYAVNPSLMD